jgi:hypothetical protein
MEITAVFIRFQNVFCCSKKIVAILAKGGEKIF